MGYKISHDLKWVSKGRGERGGYKEEKFISCPWRCVPGASAVVRAMWRLWTIWPWRTLKVGVNHQTPCCSWTPLGCFWLVASWSETFFCLPSGDGGDEFRLLCSDGTQAPISHYRSCNLGRGPGGGVVTRLNFRKVARKFLMTLQVCLFNYYYYYFTSSRFCVIKSVDVVVIYLLSVRCFLDGRAERDTDSNSLILHLLEKMIFCSKMWRRNYLFWQTTWTSSRCWVWIMWLSSKV